MGADSAAFDAVVLAGGAARRLGGVDKPAVVVEGAALLDRVLEACSGAATLTVVGPERPTARPVLWTREEPPGGGPVPALAAGLDTGSAEFVVLLAADLPFVDAAAVGRLVSALASGTADVALYVDSTGKDQFLTSAFRRSALASALAALPGPAGTRLASVFEHLGVVRVPDTERVTADCDTWEDVADARRLLAGSAPDGQDGPHERRT